MRKQENKQRTLAALTAFALVTTQIPTSAIAEVVNSGEGQTVTTQTTETSAAGDETKVETEAEPEAQAEVETVNEVQTEENTAETNAIATVSEDDGIMLLDGNSADLTVSLNSCKTTYKDLYTELDGKWGSGLGLGQYAITGIVNGTQSEQVEIAKNGETDLTLSDSGTYTVYKRVYKIENWKPKGYWQQLGTLKVTRTQGVTFKANLENGGIEGAEDGECAVDTTLTFTTKAVEGYEVTKVEAKTEAGTTELKADADGKYSYAVGKQDVTINVTYEAGKRANVDVTVENATAALFGTNLAESGNYSVAAEQSGELKVTPENGYAVTGAKLDGEALDFTYADHVATVTLDKFVDKSSHILVIETAKCELVASGTTEVGIAGRSASDFEEIIFNTVVDGEKSVPAVGKYSAVKDDVTVEYDAGGKSSWKPLNFEPSFIERIQGAQAFKATASSTEKIRITYKGDNQYYGSSLEVTINIVDGRNDSTTELAYDWAPVDYDSNFDNMKAAVLKYLDPVVYDAKTGVEVTDLSLDADFTLEGLEHKVGEYTVTVKFNGTQSEGAKVGYKPSEATATVVVVKGDSSLSVENKSVTYGTSVTVRDMVTSEPSNEETKPVIVTAGINGDAEGYASVDLHYLNETAQNLVNAALHLDEGVSVNKLLEYLNNDTVMTGLKWSLEHLAGVEDADKIVDNLQKVISTMVDWGVGGSTVSLGGSPSNAGVYLVGAVTTNGNYTTSMGLGYLTIAQKTEGVSLSFQNEIEDNKLTRDEAADFNYGVVTSGVAEGDSANLLVTFAGTSFAGKVWFKTVTVKSNEDLRAKLSEIAPTEPGAYTQIVATVGGNYLAKPISRAYTIKRDATIMALDGFVDGEYTTEYNGKSQPVTATVYDKDGAVIEGANVEYLYSGTTADGKIYYSSPKAPTAAGTYTVVAAYVGTATQGAASVTGTLYIKRADVTFTLGTNTSVYGDEVDHSKGYTIDKDLLSDEQVKAILSTITCAGEDSDHAANAEGYVVSATVPDCVASDKNVNVSIVNGKHIVLQRELKLVVNDATKVSGQDDPTFSGVVYDTKTGEKLENQDEILKALNVKFDRDDLDTPGEHVIFATWDNANYDVTLVEGALTINPSLTVKADVDENATVTADKAGAAEGEKITITAEASSDDYVFGGWSVNAGDAVVLDETTATSTVVMGSENSTVVANFIAKRTITVEADEGGTASANPEKALPGETIKLTATANEGYVFDGWEVVRGGVKLADKNAAETSFVIDEDPVVVKAHFKKVAVPTPEDKKQDTKPAKSEATTPETGDMVNIIAPVTVVVVAAIVIAAAVLVKRKNN